VDFGLSLFSNNGGRESLRNATNKRDDDVEKPDERNSEDIGIKMDLSDDLLHLVCYTLLVVINFLYVQRKLDSECTNFLDLSFADILLLGPEGFMQSWCILQTVAKC
jgi:hypothetical protein